MEEAEEEEAPGRVPPRRWRTRWTFTWPAAAAAGTVASSSTPVSASLWACSARNERGCCGAALTRSAGRQPRLRRSGEAPEVPLALPRPAIALPLLQGQLRRRLQVEQSASLALWYVALLQSRRADSLMVSPSMPLRGACAHTHLCGADPVSFLPPPPSRPLCRGAPLRSTTGTRPQPGWPSLWRIRPHERGRRRRLRRTLRRNGPGRSG